MALLNNSASLTYQFGTATESAASNVVTTNLIEDYGITAVKLSNNSNWRPSENLTYTVRIENTGTQTLYAITLQDDLGGTEPLLTFLPGSVTLNRGGVITAVTPTAVSPLTIVLPNDLLAGESVAVSYVARVIGNIDQGIDSITNSVTVSGREGSATGTVITVTPSPTLTLPRADYAQVALTKSVDKASASVNDDLTYTFELRNSGNTDATDVIITDDLPQNYTITSVSSLTGGIVTTFDETDYSVDANNQLILPTSTVKTISVPAATISGSGLTTVTIVGTVTG